MYRHNPQTARLAELVADGAIGELRLVRSAFSYSLYDADNIRLRTDVEGGALMDVGCYCVSGVAPARGGEPERSSAAHAIGASGTDWVFAGARCASRATCSRCSTAAPRSPSATSWRRSGREGSLFLDDPWHCREPVIELRRDGGVERIEVEPRGLLPARAREPERRDPRRRPAAARPRRRALRRRARSTALFESVAADVPVTLA